ncbi:MAG: hypothetical protein WCD76_10715 [Pyrinomonadaceae bacterium]
MAIKIELSTATPLPSRTQTLIEKILSSIPREHLRGIERIKIVDVIKDARLRITQNALLPGLYHPKQGSQPAWIEVAINALIPPSRPFYQKILPRLSFKGNLAAVIFSLVGQHYYLTLRHSVKKGQIEASVRSYTENQLRLWGTKEHSLRSRIFKPFQPTLERWARSLQRQAKKKS